MSNKQEKDSQFRGPDSFFIAKLVVPQDVVTDIVNLLGNKVHVKIEQQEFDHEHQTWTITCYCTDYALIADLANWHRDGNIEEFRVF